MLNSNNVHPHGTVVHWHSGVKVVALARRSTKRIGGKTRWVKTPPWCPVCGILLTQEGRRHQLTTVERLFGLNTESV